MRISDWSSDVCSSDLLFSNETNEHQTLVSLVAARLAEPGAAGRHEVRTMREHFAAIPTHGDVKIRLPLSDANAQALEEMRQALGRRLDTTLTIGGALSALLFDYVFEQIGRASCRERVCKYV